MDKPCPPEPRRPDASAPLTWFTATVDRKRELFVGEAEQADCWPLRFSCSSGQTPELEKLAGDLQSAAHRVERQVPGRLPVAFLLNGSLIFGAASPVSPVNGTLRKAKGKGGNTSTKEEPGFAINRWLADGRVVIMCIELPKDQVPDCVLSTSVFNPDTDAAYHPQAIKDLTEQVTRLIGDFQQDTGQAPPMVHLGGHGLTLSQGLLAENHSEAEEAVFLGVDEAQ